MVAVRSNEPAGVPGGFHKLGRNRISGSPQLNGIVVYGIGDTQDLCAGVGSIAMGANSFQNNAAASFNITVQDVQIAR
jgi:hypothetical protein